MNPRTLPSLPHGLTFNVIDVETANSDQATICQIGVVSVVDGLIIGEGTTLVDPEDYILRYFTNKLHGITAGMVAGAPILPDIWDDLQRIAGGRVLISHTSFDRSALNKAADRYGMKRLGVQWLDSVHISKNAWPQMSGGHNLKNLAMKLRIQFKHHDALEDARAAAAVVLRAYGQRMMRKQSGVKRYWS